MMMVMKEAIGIVVSIVAFVTIVAFIVAPFTIGETMTMTKMTKTKVMMRQ